MAPDHWVAARIQMGIPLDLVWRSRAGPLYSAGEYCGMIPVSMEGIPAGRSMLKPFKYFYTVFFQLCTLSLHIMLKDISIIRLTTLGCWRENLGMKFSFPGWNEWPLALTVRHQGGHKVRSSTFLWSLRTWRWQKLNSELMFSLHPIYILTTVAGGHQIDLL